MILSVFGFSGTGGGGACGGGYGQSVCGCSLGPAASPSDSRLADSQVPVCCVQVLAGFYKRELPANGWTEGEGSFEMEDTAMLSYSKGGVTCQVIINREGEKITLTLTCQQ